MRKAAPRDIPPPLELLCLNALWRLEQGAVRDVRRFVAPSRPLAYTTVMTLLDRLVRRGVATRRKAGRAFVYAPAVSRDAMRRLALEEFLDAYFEGSLDQLFEFLQGEARPETPAREEVMSNRLDPVLL
ncbi:MAG TPA: BlaI/MecI/CopY family transcriptional regulator [Bryobacteraceae bacterium]|nr:BlaI/MecI/CopY family transcriptional regulator [Bryobacteraceae bacterium]